METLIEEGNNVTVLRAKKYHTFTQAAWIEKHVTRAIESPNVNKRYSHLNRVIIGSEQICDDIRKHLEHHGITKLRKNGVLMIEFVLSVSPSFFKRADGTYWPNANERLKAWVRSSRGWLLQEFGTNCLTAILHQDEQTAHLHAICVPVSKSFNKKGEVVHRLNARGILGGRDKLSRLQDSYASALAPLGIKRGQRGSRATHTTLKQFYSAVNESKRICAKAALPAPEAAPSSFNSWQAIVNRLSDSLDSIHDSEINKLKGIIQELVATNEKLRNATTSRRRNT
ncbi:hypothetical protein CTT31_02210 [Pseudoalteromonas maricaloris]|uniref:MobV family relaxase n=1 Tax=Pseudoalteromonas maricaloris TaxID=184924 RepID=UPI0021AD70C0|nr:MobV family relaxase [Pseudoalteromonas flavipulchra]USE67996.1 hypothetical protein CTT31_02210 [Pseudoalteromonas flavipulchra]